MKVYGYARVSTLEQKEDRQKIALLEAGVQLRRIYVDKQSGKDFERPRYQRLLRLLEEGDVLFVKSIDRLGRNYVEVQEQWRLLTKVKKVDIVILDMPLLDTRRDKNLLGTFISDIVLQLLSFVSENERINIRQRQAEGIAAAKERGVRFGRPRIVSEVDLYEELLHWRDDEISIEELMVLTNMSRTTIYRRMREMRARGMDVRWRGRNGRSGLKND